MTERQQEKNSILILGAAGFIGTNLTLALLKKENCPGLLLFDRPGVAYAAPVMEAFREGKVQFLEGEFSLAGSGEKIKDLLKLEKVHTVYHFISTTCPTNSNKNIAAEMEANVISTIHLLDGCVETGVKKVIFLSSGGTVYGKNHTGICKEEEEAFPISSYGVTKLTIEKLLYLYDQIHGLDYRIIRLSNPYGPYQRPNGVQGVVTTFVYKALKKETIQVYGDGSVIRDYIYIEDAIDGILRIAQADSKEKLYNLGRGQGRSVSDVIEAIEEVLSEKLSVNYLPGRPVDVPVNVLDISRFEKEFGSFSPIGLKEGIERTAAFMRETL